VSTIVAPAESVRSVPTRSDPASEVAAGPFVTRTVAGCVGVQGSVAGTVTTSWVADALVTVAATPSIVTTLDDAVALNPDPAIVAEAPATIGLGAIEVMAMTEAGEFTFTAAVPDFPSLVAVIVAEPAATAVTRPVELTVAFELSEVAQVTTRPGSAAPPASRVAAVNCRVSPTASVVVDGETVTLATGAAVTVSVACPCLPPAAAMITAVPGDTPMTTPALLTVATEVVAEVQVTVPVAIAAPF